MIAKSYEQLVREGKVGVNNGYFSESNDGRLRIGPDCMRGSCHRTAKRWVKKWFLCDPCADAIAEAKKEIP